MDMKLRPEIHIKNGVCVKLGRLRKNKLTIAVPPKVVPISLCRYVAI